MPRRPRGSSYVARALALPHSLYLFYEQSSSCNPHAVCQVDFAARPCSVFSSAAAPRLKSRTQAILRHANVRTLLAFTHTPQPSPTPFTSIGGVLRPVFVVDRPHPSISHPQTC